MSQRSSCPSCGSDTSSRARSWTQVNVAPPELRTAARGGLRCMLEELSARLAASGMPAELWFVRKQPGLRIRLRRADGAGACDGETAAVVQSLAHAGLVGTWFGSVYEPETNAFGGPGATEAAHRLFVGSATAWQELDLAVAAGACKLRPLVVSMAALGDLFRACLEDEAEIWDTWVELERRYRAWPGETPDAPRLSLADIARVHGPALGRIADRYAGLNAEYERALSLEWRGGRLRFEPLPLSIGTFMASGRKKSRGSVAP
jgi:thiopeptide-type bacteriocin biosynthesis protein